ncbi:hypothetical protein KKB18_03590, partial [bacterium]|nr:hypothetical protein [bacterium]
MRGRNIAFLLIVILMGFIANAFCELEFQVNTHTDADQYNPDVVMDPSGNFVVVWTSEDQDGNGTGIFAQRFDSDGNPMGVEFQVNTTTEGDQFDPSIAMNSLGNFVIAWVGNDEDQEGIFARRYNNEGFPLGDEFQVNVHTDAEQYDPSVAMDSTGNFFAVAWTSSNQDTENSLGIYAKLYSTDGNLIKDEFLVNTYTSSNQQYTYAALDSNGNFIITWGSFGQDGDGYGVYAKIYDNTGSVKKDEFQVNTYTDSYQLIPSVAMGTNGNFVVTWSSYNQDGDGYGVYANIFDENGEETADEFQVNKYIDSTQYYSYVALDNDGNFVITWQSYGQDGYSYGVFAQGYDSTGTPLGREFQINSYSRGYQGRAEISMTGDGKYVIVYRSFNQVSTDSDYDIYARLFDIQDTPPADIISPLVEILSPENEEIVYGSIDVVINAADESGIHNVEIQVNGGDWNQCLYTGERWLYNLDTSGYIATPMEIQARASDSSENANVGYSNKISPIVVNPEDFEEFRVNTTITGTQSHPAIAMGISGDFIVAWDSNGIFARKYDITGNPISDEFQVSSQRAGARPSIGMDARGNFTVVWQTQTINVRQFDSSGNPLREEFAIAFGSNPYIAMNDAGD